MTCQNITLTETAILRAARRYARWNGRVRVFDLADHIRGHLPFVSDEDVARVVLKGIREKMFEVVE